MDGLNRTQIGTYATVAIAAAIAIIGLARSDGPSVRPGATRHAGAGAGPTAMATAPESGLEIADSAAQIVVHVAGKVRSPGLYRLAPGSRVAAAVAKAGGITAGAERSSVNLAARMSDGQQVVIPARITTAIGAMAGAGETPISIGSASVEQLEEIDGIGPVTAQKIIDFRSENGGIASIDELDEVSGIGPATLETLDDSLTP